MVNEDAIFDGLSLIDQLSAHTEEAEVKYENAKSERLPEEKIESLERALKVCKARQALACYLLDDINSEFWSREDSILVRSKDTTSRTRYTLDSIALWASIKHGIIIREWLFTENEQLTKWMLPDDVTWEDIEIRIRKDHAITYFYKDCEYDNKALSDMDLLNIKSREPNNQAGILIGLSLGERFPKTRKTNGNERAAISKLRTILKKLTGIKTDPFHPFNVTDGWKPRFKLTNEKNIADEQAEWDARRVSFNDGIKYGNDD
jgi:hypothetical protein